MYQLGVPDKTADFIAYNKPVDTEGITLGTTAIAKDTGYTWVFVQVSASSANAASAGLVFYHTTTPFVVSDDYSVVNPRLVAGISGGVITKAYYGWILSTAYPGAASVKALSSLKASVATWNVKGASTDGCATKSTIAVSMDLAFGILAAAKASGTVVMSVQWR
jgi:hypothetical protein